MLNFTRLTTNKIAQAFIHLQSDNPNSHLSNAYCLKSSFPGTASPSQSQRWVPGETISNRLALIDFPGMCRYFK
jgi:hypothetical protein